MHGIVLRLKLTHIYLLCAWLFSVLFFVFFVFVSSLSFLFLSICLHWWRLRPLLRNTQHSTITYTTANASSQKKVLILSRNVYISFWNSKCVSIFSVCFFFFSNVDLPYFIAGVSVTLSCFPLRQFESLSISAVDFSVSPFMAFTFGSLFEHYAKIHFDLFCNWFFILLCTNTYTHTHTHARTHSNSMLSY